MDDQLAMQRRNLHCCEAEQEGVFSSPAGLRSGAVTLSWSVLTVHRCACAEDGAAMETEEKEGAGEGSKEGEAGEPAKAPSKAPEALSHRLDNPCRVTPAQQKFVALEEGSRWRPIHPARPLTGIIVFKDLQPGAPSFPLPEQQGPTCSLPPQLAV